MNHYKALKKMKLKETFKSFYARNDAKLEFSTIKFMKDDTLNVKKVVE